MELYSDVVTAIQARVGIQPSVNVKYVIANSAFGVQYGKTLSEKRIFFQVSRYHLQFTAACMVSSIHHSIAHEYP